MTETAHIHATLTSAQPRAMAALVRYFRDMDVAEEALQNACLKALKSWPLNGTPRDPTAWLVLVGRNAGIDTTRRRTREQPIVSDAALSDLDDPEPDLVDRLDESHYRDDLLRLMFVCCHPILQPAQQIALALRLVSGLSVGEIARAFLSTEAAIEQRLTRAKRKVATAGVPFETPGAAERAERLAAVMAVVYLLFNEGYAASGGVAHVRGGLCDEAIRLARLIVRMFPGEPEVLGLTALLLLQHARTPARLDGDGQIVLLEDQDRSRWNRGMIDEGLALLDKAIRHNRPGAYQVQAAIAALHARAARAAETDWAGIDLLYATLEVLQPSPVVTLNRAVAVSKARGPAAALALIEPLAEDLSGYFYFHGLKGALLRQIGRSEEAEMAFTLAIAKANTAAEAAHIRQQIDRLKAEAAATAKK